MRIVQGRGSRRRHDLHHVQRHHQPPERIVQRHDEGYLAVEKNSAVHKKRACLAQSRGQARFAVMILSN